jgi:large subunit ribosomal protein L10
MARELKTILCGQLANDFRGLTGCVLIDYAGLDAQKTYELRRSLRKDGVRMRVVHNRLARRILGAAAGPEFAALFRGPTALLIGEDGALSASRSITNWLKKNKDLAKIKGGLSEGRVLSTVQVGDMARLPDKATLLAQTAAMFLAPIRFLPSAAQSLLSHFAGCAKARHEQLSKESLYFPEETRHD